MKAVVNPLHLSKTYNPRSPVYYECITMVSHVTMAVTFAVARHAVHDIMVDGAGAGGGGAGGGEGWQTRHIIHEVTAPLCVHNVVSMC